MYDHVSFAVADLAASTHLPTHAGRAELACGILRDLLAAAHDPHKRGCPDGSPKCWSLSDTEVQSAKRLLLRLDAFTS